MGDLEDAIKKIDMETRGFAGQLLKPSTAILVCFLNCLAAAGAES
jgi:hypothetical protein